MFPEPWENLSGAMSRSRPVPKELNFSFLREKLFGGLDAASIFSNTHYKVYADGFFSLVW